MSASAEKLRRLQKAIWDGSIPLQISLAPTECRTYEASNHYLIQYPRVSYLPALLPRLKAFFVKDLINPDVAAHEGWFSCQGVPLKWQYPLGLLYDIYSGAEPAGANGDSSKQAHGTDDSDDGDEGDLKIEQDLPWKLEVHFTEWPIEFLIPLDADWKINHDVFINTVKEADFLRNGSARVIMSLSKDDSTKLWTSIQEHDFDTFNYIYQKFLNVPGGQALRYIPVKVYLPHAETDSSDKQARGRLRVVQGPITPTLVSREVQTLGTALHSLLPTVFPSRRTYIHAHAVLHGAVVPLSTPMVELVRYAAYSDGFLHIAVLMLG